ncbi:MAG: TRAP transporter large permease subunit [Candidatus Rokuibacteriota bacterium]
MVYPLAVRGCFEGIRLPTRPGDNPVGHVTPPVGLCLFVGMAISGLPMEKLVRPLVPSIAAILVVLLLVAFVPGTVLLIPRLLGFVK